MSFGKVFDVTHNRLAGNMCPLAIG
jgi:hypothetical protein